MEIDYDVKNDGYARAWEQSRLCFTQHPAWGEVKRQSYQPNYILAGGTPMAIYIRKLPLVGGKFGYSPRAFAAGAKPDPDWLARASTQICRHYGLSHLVIEPNIELTNEKPLAGFEKAGFRAEEETVQPRHSRWIDLGQSHEKLLADMSKDVRRRISRAAGEGYSFEERSDGNGLEQFYGSLGEVARRAKFDIQPKGYFADILRYFPAGAVHIYFCRDKAGALLYATFTINDGEAFRRIYGGPSLAGRRGDAAQFTAAHTIKAAQKLGAKTMDLWGVAPYTDEGFASGHPLSGVSQFKASLGGRNVTYWPQLIWVENKPRFAAYQRLLAAHRTLKRLKRVVR